MGMLQIAIGHSLKIKIVVLAHVFNVHVLSGDSMLKETGTTITKTSPCNEHPLTPHFYI